MKSVIWHGLVFTMFTGITSFAADTHSLSTTLAPVIFGTDDPHRAVAPSAQTPQGGGLYENYSGSFHRWIFSKNSLVRFQCDGQSPDEQTCNRSMISVDLSLAESETLFPLFLERLKRSLLEKKPQLIRQAHSTEPIRRWDFELAQNKEGKKLTEKKITELTNRINFLKVEIDKLENLFKKDPELKKNRPDLVGLLGKYQAEQESKAKENSDQNGKLAEYEKAISSLSTQITEAEGRAVGTIENQLKLISKIELPQEISKLFSEIATSSLPVLMDKNDGKLPQYESAAWILPEYYKWLTEWANVFSLSGKPGRVPSNLMNKDLPYLPEVKPYHTLSGLNPPGESMWYRSHGRNLNERSDETYVFYGHELDRPHIYNSLTSFENKSQPGGIQYSANVRELTRRYSGGGGSETERKRNKGVEVGAFYKNRGGVILSFGGHNASQGTVLLPRDFNPTDQKRPNFKSLKLKEISPGVYKLQYVEFFDGNANLAGPEQ